MRATGMRVTLSGSFHRHLSSIQESVETLTAYGASVLSPADPRVVDRFGDFLFVASDIRRSIRGIQNRHLDSIRTSSLVRLECDDGHVGLSAAFETGYAVARGVPVIASFPPNDPLIRRHVIVVSQPIGALEIVAHMTPEWRNQMSYTQPSLLVTPNRALQATHDEVEQLELVGRSKRSISDQLVDRHLQKIQASLTLPARTQGHGSDLDAIRSLRFVWLHQRHGSLDTSTVFKIGYATALGVPVFASCPPNDLTIRQYISIAATPRIALARLQGLRHIKQDPNQLSLHLDQPEALTAIHLQLEEIYVDLASSRPSENDPIEGHIESVRQLLVSA